MKNNEVAQLHNEPTKICIGPICAEGRAKPLSEFAVTNRRRMDEPEGRSEICRECTQRARVARNAQTMAQRENIPKRLVNWRRRENLTQEEAAIRLDLVYGTYVGYEQDHRGKWMNEHRYRYIIEKTASAMDEATTGSTAGQKAAKTRNRKTAAAKAVKTRKRRAAGKKAAQTRKRRAAGRKAAATRKARRSSSVPEESST